MAGPRPRPVRADGSQLTVPLDERHAAEGSRARAGPPGLVLARWCVPRCRSPGAQYGERLPMWGGCRGAIVGPGRPATPEEIERQWFEQVYKGSGDSMAQLTWRAVIMGSVLGGVLSLTNLYIGLKSGWLFGVAITSCILSYAIWTSLYKVGLVRTKMTILENNCMQSTASAAA